jgi:phosphoadenosine phosphosulfate reductase
MPIPARSGGSPNFHASLPAPEALAARLGRLPTAALVSALAAEFRGRIALVSSFGADAAVLLHLVAEADAEMPVLFLDTGKMFPETLAYRDRLARRLGLRDLRVLRPDPEELGVADPLGGLWNVDPNGCCALRKTAPLRRALAGFGVWISGRKRHQAATRAALPLFENDEAGRLKANPLAAWNAEALEAYRVAHDLPAHPLVAEGYPSIGCHPCTSRVLPGEDARAGRWRGRGKTECGIHRRPPCPAAPLLRPVSPSECRPA